MVWMPGQRVPAAVDSAGGDVPRPPAAPASGAGLTMIGAGRDRGAFTAWSVNTTTTPDTWTVVAPTGTVDAAGYLRAGSTLSQTGTDAWPPSASVTR